MPVVIAFLCIVIVVVEDIAGDYIKALDSLNTVSRRGALAIVDVRDRAMAVRSAIKTAQDASTNHNIKAIQSNGSSRHHGGDSGMQLRFEDSPVWVYVRRRHSV